MFNQAALASPKLAGRLDMQILQASNMRHSGNVIAHSQQLQLASESAMAVGWSQIARQELQLANRQAEQVKWLAFASRTSQPPVLDGQLLEACWQAAPAMRLSQLTSDSQPPTMIAWAFDADYLYVATDSPRDPTKPATELASERHYDADLSALDHVHLVLDTDRDYNTAVEYSIAENGLTAERCCDFASYNPRWHVCVRPGVEHWVAEIAIPLSTLTASPAVAGTAWALSARRVIPGQEPQSWSQLRSHRPLLQGSGLLLFAPEPSAAD
jgi:hypothetical protein